MDTLAVIQLIEDKIVFSNFVFIITRYINMTNGCVQVRLG